MKVFFLTTSFLLIFGLFAQDKEQESVIVDFNKILIGINFSPDFSYRTLFNNDGNSFNNVIIDSRNERELAKFGYTFGLNFNYNFNKNIGFGTGLLFSNKGYQASFTNLFFGNVNQGFGNTIVSTTPQSLKFYDNFYYLDIPIRGIFSFGKGSFRFITSIGVTTNILIKSTTTSVTEYNDGSTSKTTQTAGGYNRVNISPQISIGVEKKIKNRSYIRLEPTFRYGLLNIIEAPITAKLWNAGLNISYYFGAK